MSPVSTERKKLVSWIVVLLSFRLLFIVFVLALTAHSASHHPSFVGCLVNVIFLVLTVPTLIMGWSDAKYLKKLL
jgi:hypothetical protein